MRISATRFLKELQLEFCSEFPFLEMSFFKPGDRSPVNLRIEPSLLVGDVRVAGNDGMLVLNGNHCPTAVEDVMADIFGLRVKFGYRKGLRGRFDPSAKRLAELNHTAMHMAEEVVII
jgi:hypothetical protein